MALSEQMLLQRSGLTTASEYQIAIFQHIASAVSAYLDNDPVRNAVVEAVAGSGKTTTIVHGANFIPTSLSAVFLAFNKDIQLELEKRLPKHVWAKTLNAMGWGILRNYVRGLEGVNPEIQGNKTWTIMRQLGRESRPNGQFLRQHGKSVKFIVDKAKAYGIVPANLEGNGFESANGLRDDMETWKGLFAHFGETVDAEAFPMIVRLAREILNRSLADLTVVDFDDQKYLPVVMRTESGARIPCKPFDVIIIDEVQDVSPVDRALIEMIAKPNAIVMGVGDSRQAIYGFRGADTKSIEVFQSTFNADVLPLSISYRCSKAVVEHAREVYPVIEFAPGAAEGAVTTLGQYDAATFTPGDMVICRNNAPIVDFAYKLIRARVPVFVKGRDIGRGLISLIDNLKAGDVRELALNLDLWEARQVELILDDNPDNEDAVERIRDRAATVRVFIGENHDGRVESVKADIESLFKTNGKDKDDGKDMRGKVVLSTMHKAKGLEAPKVFILDYFLMYGRWIKPDTWQMVQEANLDYVARTRAMDELVYVESKKFVE